MVLSAITIQYLLNVEQTIIEWIWINILFESIGESKAAAVTYATVGPSWSYLLTNINAFLLAVIADSLMVRTRFSKIYLPLINSFQDMEMLPCLEWIYSSHTFSVTVTSSRDWSDIISCLLYHRILKFLIGVGIANVVKISIDRFNSVKYFAGHSLWMQTSLALFSTFALTMITTSLIVYRIYTISRHNNFPSRTQTTFKGIVDLIVQSSAVYSMILLLYAISWTITESSSATPTVLQHLPQNYLLRFTEQLSFIFAVHIA